MGGSEEVYVGMTVSEEEPGGGSCLAETELECEVFGGSINCFIGSIMWLLQRFAYSVITDEHM